MEALANIQIITNEVQIINNMLPNGQFKASPKFFRKTGTVDDNKHFTELTIEIRNTEETPFPIDLRIRMTCVFDLSNIDPDQIDKFLKIQGIQILFPYLRTMVSNVTASAMMPPIVLPIIDVLKLFPEDQNN